MRKMMNEQLPISKSSPLKARFYDYPYFTYPWHFHTEYEIIYVKEGTGMRFVGNNAEKYADGDILLLGSDLPHYMKIDSGGDRSRSDYFFPATSERNGKRRFTVCAIDFRF